VRAEFFALPIVGRQRAKNVGCHPSGNPRNYFWASLPLLTTLIRPKTPSNSLLGPAE